MKCTALLNFGIVLEKMNVTSVLWIQKILHLRDLQLQPPFEDVKCSKVENWISSNNQIILQNNIKTNIEFRLHFLWRFWLWFWFYCSIKIGCFAFEIYRVSSVDSKTDNSIEINMHSVDIHWHPIWQSFDYNILHISHLWLVNFDSKLNNF